MISCNRIIPTFLLFCSFGIFTSCDNSTAPKALSVNQIRIDDSVQSAFDSLLINRMEELKTEAAFGAVMEVSTGNLLAISSWKYTQDSVSPANNSMFLQLTDPGSVFQAVTYTALLETGKITPDSLVDTGNYPDNPSTLNFHGKEVRDDHPLGVVSAEEALVQSSNIAMVKMVANAFGNNPKEYLDAIAKLGWYETPLMVFNGDTLSHSRVRIINDPTWSKVSLGQISYGYEMRATPMHTLMFFNSIANNGVRPGYGRICSENTANHVKNALVGVADRIAGKTGTAQIYENGTYIGNGHYVTFVGFFPAEHPRYTCLVTLKARPGGNYGRPNGEYMARPIVQELAERIIE